MVIRASAAGPNYPRVALGVAQLGWTLAITWRSRSKTGRWFIRVVLSVTSLLYYAAAVEGGQVFSVFIFAFFLGGVDGVWFFLWQGIILGVVGNLVRRLPWVLGFRARESRVAAGLRIWHLEVWVHLGILLSGG